MISKITFKRILSIFLKKYFLSDSLQNNFRENIFTKNSIKYILIFSLSSKYIKTFL